MLNIKHPDKTEKFHFIFIFKFTFNKRQIKTRKPEHKSNNHAVDRNLMFRSEMEGLGHNLDLTPQEMLQM